MAHGDLSTGRKMQYDLDRFVEAQSTTYARALSEIARGRKTSHWMWFVFPQLAGLGRSEMARRFAIGSLDEARAYLAHPVIGKRYIECVTALQDLPTSDAIAVFGPVDAVKLRSSLTLFMRADETNSLLGAALDRWFQGEEDKRTLALLGQQAG